MPEGVRVQPQSPASSHSVLTLIDWFANQSIYGTPESRRTAPQSDHRRSPRRHPEARPRRGVRAAHRQGSRLAGGARAPLFRVEGRPPDRDGRSSGRGPPHAPARRARRPRSRARARARSRFPLHRASRRSHAQRAVRGDRRRGAQAPAASQALRGPRQRNRRRADGDARSPTRLPRPARRERRPGDDVDLSVVRGGRHLAIRPGRHQPAPTPPHGGRPRRASSRSESWKS